MFYFVLQRDPLHDLRAPLWAGFETIVVDDCVLGGLQRCPINALRWRTSRSSLEAFRWNLIDRERFKPSETLGSIAQVDFVWSLQCKGA